MSAELTILDLRNRRQWRAWLARHHGSSPGIWFTFHKKHSEVKSIPYEEVIREALCYGWIDSIVKRVDDERYLLKFTRRKPTSKWSDLNRRRWAELEKEGLLAAPGRAAAPTGNRYAPRPSIPVLPGYIHAALKANPQAWKFFQALSPTDRRYFVVWIHIAKRPETREKRIHESIALLAAGRKLGLK